MTKRDYSTCSNANCTNPKNGQLTRKAYRRWTLQTGEVRIHTECRMCYNLGKKTKDKKPAAGHGDMTALQVANCPLDVKLAQAFILGRVA